MKLTFLGTGTSQGVPVIACTCEVCKSCDKKDKRLRTSVLIENHSDVFVIDTGPDFRQQMLREKVSRLDAVLFTHEHKDHISGLDDIRAFNYFQNNKMDVFATERVQQAIKREFAYIFSDEKYPGIPELELKTITDKSFYVGQTEVVPIEVMHYHMPVKAFRINNFTYITDANHISDSELKKIKGSEYIVINALRREKHISHFTLTEALALLVELNPKEAYLTHLSHQMGLHELVQKELPSFVHIAYDGLQIEC